MFGEEVWLKPDQDVTCRLYGCDNPGQEMVFLHGKTLPGRVMFCKRHAAQYANREILVAGVTGRRLTDN